MPRRIDITDEQVKAALLRCRGNRSAAAQLLGISLRTLARRISANPSLRFTHELPSGLAPFMGEILLVQLASAGHPPSMRKFLDAVGWGLQDRSTQVLGQQEVDDLVKDLWPGRRQP